MKLFLISNMYPSNTHPVYGIFVKNFEISMIAQNVSITAKSVIRGRGKNTFEKIYKYLCFIISIQYNGLVKKFDLVYVHYINHTSIPVLLLSLFRPSIKLVINSHGGDIFLRSAFSKIIGPLRKRLIMKSSLVVCPSEYFKEVLLERFHLNHSKIFVSASGGINLNLFKPQAVVKSGFTIGFISRIDENKGWDIFIDAINYLVKTNILSEFKAVMVGGGKFGEELFELINKYDLNHYINYLGPKSQSELPSIINSFDLFVFPTLREEESLGLIGLEAMACSVPVIGSKMAGLENYIRNHENGFFFEPGNSIDLAKKIIIFNSFSKEEKEKMRKKAYETALIFDEKKVRSELKQKLETLL